MIPLSVLDLVPVRENGSIGEALSEATQAAQAAEAVGYKRFWVAEHHGMDGIAGGATSVVLAHVGSATSTIRIGAGGIMLPNHNPFVIAEQFGTLEALFPGRVDLGLGRAPGADARISQALRKDLVQAANRFPEDVVELRARLRGNPPLPVVATPGTGSQVEIWILGSSLFGAQLAAMLGLPYAFASHFAPAQLDTALQVYRERFTPSEELESPHVMAAMTVICADSDEHADYLASTLDQGLVALSTGAPGRMKPPVRDYREGLAPDIRANFRRMDEARAVGSPKTVRDRIDAFIRRTGADEIIVAGATYDAAARRRSLELTMEAMH